MSFGREIKQRREPETSARRHSGISLPRHDPDARAGGPLFRRGRETLVGRIVPSYRARRAGDAFIAGEESIERIPNLCKAHRNIVDLKPGFVGPQPIKKRGGGLGGRGGGGDGSRAGVGGV